ncbi:MAG: sigma-70 family RNA polymerase sigma factor [Flavobacteriaceae bacterium]
MTRILDEIEACIPALRRYARALTRDVSLADDLVQDCLERALRKQTLWRPTASVRSWLFSILLNIRRDDLRRERRAPAPLPVDTLAAEPATGEAQSARLAAIEVSAAIATLPPDQREALLLVVLEDFSYGEAAAALGIPLGTLMSRIGRAREQLREATERTPPARPTQPARLRTVK